jgi:hypothetical protein
MAKFVVEIHLICRYIMDANTKDEAEKLVWNHKNLSIDMSDADEHYTTAMTKEEYDIDHTNSHILFDLDLGREAWLAALRAHFRPNN